MKKLLLLIFSLSSTMATAEFFGYSGYNLDKNIKDVTKYSTSIYGTYIDYDLKGETLRNFTNYCIVQKDTLISQPIECTRDAKGNFLTSYMKMFIVINIDNKTNCISNILYYDKKDNLLQNHQLTTINQCRWDIIPPTSSIDEARDFITKNRDKIN